MYELIYIMIYVRNDTVYSIYTWYNTWTMSIMMLYEV